MTLLIAGALGIDAEGLIAGAGGLASIAAAPLASVQLWSRGGALAEHPREILSRRQIDLSGVTWDGAVPVFGADGRESTPVGTSLGSCEPTSADGLRAVLVVGLAPAEEVQALRAARALKAPILIVASSTQLDPLKGVVVRSGQPSRRVASAIATTDDGDDANDGDEGAHAEEDGIDVRIETLASALRLTGTSDALAAAKALQAAGAKAVVLTTGMLGGLLVFGDRAVSFPVQAIPETLGQRGAFAAFAGALAGWCEGAGANYTALMRGCTTAGVVAGFQVQGGVKRLLGADRAQYLERFNRLRRLAKS